LNTIRSDGDELELPYRMSRTIPHTSAAVHEYNSCPEVPFVAEKYSLELNKKKFAGKELKLPTRISAVREQLAVSVHDHSSNPDNPSFALKYTFELNSVI